MHATDKYLPTGFTLQRGRYKIIKKRASGGFGFVYLARCMSTGQVVAIKELFVKNMFIRQADGSVTVKPEHLGFLRRVKERFSEEANTIRSLNHQNIVKVQRLFAENNTLYYVMDLISGASLYTLISHTGAISEKAAIKYISQVASALRYLHENTRLHLDVKPSNIMIDKQGNAILIDFGISVNYGGNGAAAINDDALLLGISAGYSPPELFYSKTSAYKPASDIYSLAATLYFMVSGNTPVSSKQRVKSETFDIDRLKVSQQVRGAIGNAMTLNPSQRPSTIDEFMNILYGRIPVRASAGSTSASASKVAVGAPAQQPFDFSSVPDLSEKDARAMRPIISKYADIDVDPEDADPEDMATGGNIDGEYIIDYDDRDDDSDDYSDDEDQPKCSKLTVALLWIFGLIFLLALVAAALLFFGLIPVSIMK